MAKTSILFFSAALALACGSDPAQMQEPAAPVDFAIDSAEAHAEWFTEGSSQASVTREQSKVLASIKGVPFNEEARLATYFDAAPDAVGISFLVCGEGTLTFEVFTDETIAQANELGASNHFQKEIPLYGKWQRENVLWTELGQPVTTHTFNPESVRGISFTVFGRDLRVQVMNVQFFDEHGLLYQYHEATCD